MGGAEHEPHLSADGLSITVDARFAVETRSERVVRHWWTEKFGAAGDVDRTDGTGRERGFNNNDDDDKQAAVPAFSAGSIDGLSLHSIIQFEPDSALDQRQPEYVEIAVSQAEFVSASAAVPPEVPVRGSGIEWPVSRSRARQQLRASSADACVHAWPPRSRCLVLAENYELSRATSAAPVAWQRGSSSSSSKCYSQCRAVCS